MAKKYYLPKIKTYNISIVYLYNNELWNETFQAFHFAITKL
jgi:hypothetical protein